VDTPPPETLSDPDLLVALAAHWEVQADSVRYVPKGAGSYHWMAAVGGHPRYFVTADDLDTKPWIGDQRQLTFEGLRAAYQTAWALERHPGLSLVVGPVRASDGSVTVRLSDQYAVTVFPFVEGVAGHWGGQVSRSGRAELLRQLAGLHQVTGRLAIPVGRRPLDLPERPSLTAALHALDRPWQGGPLAERARNALADHAGAVIGWLAELDGLARSLQEAETERIVVTHGEPHPGNLIMTGQGLRLIDWDTVALALPERDLWMLDDGSADALAPYVEVTGRTVNETAVSFFKLAWTLSDIASFADMFRSPHEQTGWIDQKWNAFLCLLGGAGPTPYDSGRGSQAS
jgi:spectinomycin phosphotransferase